MKTRSLLHILMGAACAFPLIAQANPFPSGSPAFITSYAKLLADQKATGKPAIIIFSASWCPPCQIMKKETYPSPAVSPYHQSFLWAYLDADDPANQTAAMQYGVQGLPHHTFLEGTGRPLGYLTGADKPSAFAKVLQTVLRQIKSTGKTTASL